MKRGRENKQRSKCNLKYIVAMAFLFWEAKLK